LRRGAGFFFSYNASSLKPNITEAAWQLEADYPGEPWYILGHSMGSAMATICALDLKVGHTPSPCIEFSARDLLTLPRISLDARCQLSPGCRIESGLRPVGVRMLST